MKANSNIVEQQNLPDLQQVFERLTTFFERLQRSRQRVMLNYRGSRDWRHAILRQQLEARRTIVFSDDETLPAAIPFSKAAGILGSEADCVVYDGASGIQIDVLCMAAGLLRSGGCLLLLTSAESLQAADRYGVWQGAAAAQPCFLRYFFARLEVQHWVLRESGRLDELDKIELPSSSLARFEDGMGEQQARVFRQLQRWWNNSRQSVFVLTADRGRGKSTLLGVFARQLDAQTPIVITAAARSQLDMALRQLDQHQDHVRFIAPDEIIRRRQPIDCLLIDEAAMLPPTLLQQCLALARKTVLATTTGGYEGTGNGFALKFVQSLPVDGVVHASLQQPIRWGENDVLEQWMNQTLFLKLPEKATPAMLPSVTIRRVEKKQLAQDITLLESIVGLLVSAHYRTRPSDLRQLMEDGFQQILIAESEQTVVGVLLLNEEGDVEPALSQQIFMGRRRPQGHLLAQMLTAQAGVRDFACLRGLRVQRVAVAQTLRRQGIGRQLMTQAIALAQRQGHDYIGSCFAIDATVLPFWQALDFELVHIAAGKGVSAMQQTVAVIKPLQPDCDRLLNDQRAKIKQYLPVWLMGMCREMGWREVIAMLNFLQIRYDFNPQEQQELQAFAEGYRGFEYAQPLLQRWLISTRKLTALDDADARLAVQKILQNNDWSSLAEAVGKKQGLKNLRRIIAHLLAKQATHE